jgi:hypothetical protein
VHAHGFSFLGTDVRLAVWHSPKTQIGCSLENTSKRLIDADADMSAVGS